MIHCVACNECTTQTAPGATTPGPFSFLPMLAVYRPPMRAAIVFIGIAAGAVLLASALLFDAGTLAFVALTMLVVAFFAGSWVLLGALSRGRLPRPDRSLDHAEVIPDDHPTASFPRPGEEDREGLGEPRRPR